MFYLKNLFSSALALFVPRIGTDHANHSLAPDNLAVAANFLDRSRNPHHVLQKLMLIRLKLEFTLP
jgi:hypothetical protein